MTVQLNFTDEKGKPFSFRRILLPSNQCEYFVNGDPKISEEYLSDVAKMGLNIQHFCAYQGKLEEMCFKGGMSLTDLFEEISGSVRFKKDYNHCKE